MTQDEQRLRELCEAQQFEQALAHAEHLLSQNRRHAVAGMYRAICLHGLKRWQEAMSWYRHMEQEDLHLELTDASHTLLFTELKAELELSLTFSHFSAYDQQFDMPFPASKAEYEAGKKQFDHAAEFNVGSARFEQRYEKAGELLKKAAEKHPMHNKAVFIGGLVIAPILLTIVFFYYRDSAAAISFGRYSLGMLYFIGGALVYRYGARTPGYLLAQRLKEARFFKAVDVSMANAYSNTRDSKTRIVYTDGSSEIKTGAQSLQVGLTFLFIKIGFFFLRIAWIGWIGVVNLVRNRE